MRRVIRKEHTQSFVFLHRLVVSSADLGPLGEFVLGARVVHLSLQLHHLALEPALFPGIFRRGCRGFEVELPELFDEVSQRVVETWCKPEGAVAGVWGEKNRTRLSIVAAPIVLIRKIATWTKNTVQMSDNMAWT